MHTVLQDARYALRLFRRYRAFTVVSVLTLALGIGVSTSIFSVINAVLFRPLPYADPERLVLIRAQAEGGAAAPALAPAEVADLREATHLFRSVAALVVVNGDLTARQDDLPMERVTAASATDNFFSTLGVPMALGRPLHQRADTGRDTIRAVVMSHELWARRFAANPGLVGRTIEVNNLTVTVAGILPAGFRLFLGDDSGVPHQIDLWFPASLERDRQSRHYVTVARLSAGTSLAQAQSQLRALAGRLTAAHPEAYKATPLILQADLLQAHAARTVKPALIALGGAVMLVLLIACANVANLLLARTTTRGRELAVRVAVGAGRGRVLRQLLTEGLMLGLTGGALGLLIAQWADGIVQWTRPPTMPPAEARTDPMVLAFACGITLLACLLFTLAPALHGLRRDTVAALRGGGRALVTEGRRLRTALVVAEVALAVILLTGAGLMIRTAAALRTVDKGFDERNVLTLRVSMRPREFDDFERKWQFYRQALEQVAAIPGVQRVGAIRPLPLEGTTFTGRVDIVETGHSFQVASHTTLPGYFEAMGIRLLEGRDLEPGDISQQRDVVLVDERFARAGWPGAAAVGRRIAVRRGPGPAATMTVIGVVAHVHASGLRDSGAPQLYLPYHRHAIFDMALTVKTLGDPAHIASAARDRIEALGGKRPVYMVRPMADYVADASAETRFVLILLGAFAALAVLLSLVGLYGVVAYTTLQRTREIGIRIALGASRADIVRLVIGGGLSWAAAGIAAGTLTALALTRSLRTLLFGVAPGDPLTIGAVAIALTAVSLLASYAPARRATRIPASDALRAE